jgi:AraC-like DNA-binding protein
MVKGGARLLAPGDVLVVNTSLHRISAGPANREFEFHWFGLLEDQLFPLFSAQELCLLHHVLGKLGTGKWYPANSELARQCHRLVNKISPREDLDHRVQLLQVAAWVLSAEFKQAQRPPAICGPVDGHMAKLFEKVSGNELTGSTVTVTELAKRFSCSRRHLNRLFQQYLGCSVVALKKEMRLTRAMCLLRDPRAKLAHVAEQCGFNHLGHFNECFKRRFGATPGHWRKLRWLAEHSANGFPAGEATCALRRSGLCPWSPNHSNGHGSNGARQARVVSDLMDGRKEHKLPASVVRRRGDPSSREHEKPFVREKRNLFDGFEPNGAQP